ncbi:MAG: hypothetical protein FWE29_04135 [Defluviitaleaceae bacterium]|nr:hypothetical protein [Defluviitaleaceae bacterium]
MLTKIHLLICLIAAISVCVLNIINDVPFESATINLITIIVLFYFFGFAAKYYLGKHVFPPKIEENEVASEAESEAMEEAGESKERILQDEFDENSEGTTLTEIPEEVKPRSRRPKKPVTVLAESEADE